MVSLFCFVLYIHVFLSYSYLVIINIFLLEHNFVMVFFNFQNVALYNTEPSFVLVDIINYKQEYK